MTETAIGNREQLVEQLYEETDMSSCLKMVFEHSRVDF